jgi:hypothetical protein
MKWMSAGCGLIKETITGMRGNGRDAPIAVLRCSHAEWRGSTLPRPSRRRQQTVGSAEKRTFAPDFTRPK